MPRTPAGSAQWNDFANVYDQFKVHGMRLRLFFPPAWGSYTTALPNSLDPGTAVAIYYDNDSTVTTTFQGASEYTGVGFFSPSGEVSYSVPALPLGKVNCAGVAADSLWTPVADQAQLLGDIDVWISIPTFASPAMKITMVYEWDVEFQEMA